MQIAFRPAPGARFDEGLGDPPFDAARDWPHRPREREGRQQVEPIRDGVRRVAGRHRYGGVGAEHLTDAARVDHDIGANVHPPFRRERDQIGIALVLGGLRWVDHEQQLAAPFEIPSQQLGFGRQHVGRRPGDDEHGGVGRDLARLREHDGVDGKVVTLERLGDRAVPLAVAARRVPLAVPLHEKDRPLFAFHRLDERVSQLLLPVRHDAFNPALVLEDHRAVGLHFVLPGADRVPVDVDILHRYLGRRVLVLPEPVAIAGKLLFTVEDEHADRRIERLEDAARLV